ncbi:MAG: Efflux ABC transporter, permease protein [Candidatus Beckwithbacteria bacterium GW2011_GWB1_47_15]|uniref:Efflux ABC transporter, permease protein n=1 Tax=Candidatus Beckwithbacteria bacterium GW2011_GWB1_47_15 TaxID=1618371 RepID=A0A0G1UUE7_9BACT|nr:MAG: hypothetical protein UY43_C0001G0457 [Candidatus Beckwithbacteria bacterium GW2011_GWC1_49_16]KKU34941.1 MAG: Efflux ABC transporter, permease protein [Candidatus Beckwithbacteria bacterium GW2011_GWA1_46_30]KKU61350.1 MAG: Efflux ABC transporter, permease protein [Candidatus Beckwithbacteria bacterium GW2011_GWB1_47_15]KKU71379.1 MAG: Efflux ABC transporter, permease protein [Candidatus Beckwithbacteria bacterium GW2011_GWA2_47_25]OGD48705.1 MAG: hypothetical protein A2877_03460 [Candi
MKPDTLSDIFTTAIASFKRNKIRTVLTSLGITIGVMSVVLLIGLGVGLKNYLSDQFESLGSNLVIVFPGNVFSDEGGLGGGFGPGFAGGATFDEKDYLNLKKIPQADYVVPQFFRSLPVTANGESQLGYVEGVTADAFKILNLSQAYGQAFEATDVNRKTKVAVLGFAIAEKLFSSPEKAVGKTIITGNQRLKVIGVNAKKGDREMDNIVLLPYTTTFGRLNPNKTFFTIFFGVNDEANIASVINQAEKILAKRYDEDSFSVTEQTEILSTVNQVFGIVNAILVAIGSISLLVGGIGIMNIMYATVTERTKEVGIRRAIGATRQDILSQFLSESVVLSVLGGLIGLALASLIILVIRQFFPAAINLLSVVIAFSVSTAIGVFFGVFPAKRAANLPPIEAIRYE